MEPEDTLDFNFNSANVVNKVIIKVSVIFLNKNENGEKRENDDDDDDEIAYFSMRPKTRSLAQSTAWKTMN